MSRQAGYLKRDQEPFSVARFDYTGRLVAAQNNLSAEQKDALVARWNVLYGPEFIKVTEREV